MKQLIAALAALAFCAGAHAFQPRTGQWWNPNESGSGYNIDIQNGVLVVTVFSYKGSGDSEWYLAAAALTNGGKSFTATLDKYRNGQCISCAFVGRPGAAGNDGAIAIAFTSETAATLTLPGGRTAAIVPYNFGFLDPPAGFYGEWIFVYDIGTTTFAERFNFSTTIPGTVNGSGIAKDTVRNAGCEAVVAGSLAGTVLCVDLTAAGALQNQYAFRYGLDETYGGTWTSPTSGNSYTMKGFRLKGSNGSSKGTAIENEALGDAKDASDRATKLAAPTALHMQEAFADMAAALRASP